MLNATKTVSSLTGSGVSQLLGGLTDNVKKQSSTSDYGDILSSGFGGSDNTSNTSDNGDDAVDKAKDVLGNILSNIKRRKMINKYKDKPRLKKELYIGAI